MSETWLKSEFSDRLIHIPWYSLYRLYRSWSEGKDRVKKGVGLAMYIKSKISNSDSVVKHINVSSKDVELHCITINLPMTRKILIVNVYRPPQGDTEV